MSFVDTVGPFVLCVLVGSAAALAALGWVAAWVAPRVMHAQANASFNRQAKRFIDDVIAESRLNGTFGDAIPASLLDEAFNLKDFYLKEINK